MRYIYSLKNPENNEIKYIGQTDNIRRRFNDHLRKSLNPNDSEYETYKSRWIRKLLNEGVNPVLDIIEECDTIEISNNREKFWIEKMTEMGVKLTNSYVNDVTEFSEETKKKMSSAKKGKKLEEIIGKEKAEKLRLDFIERNKKYWTGREKTEEQKNKISNKLKEFFSDKENHWAYGKKMSNDHNEKLRNAKLNNAKNVGNRTHRTDNQKKKLRERILGSKVKRNKILQFDLNGNIIKEWNSIREIARETNFLRPQIAKCCKGIKDVYAGFIWKYK